MPMNLFRQRMPDIPYAVNKQVFQIPEGVWITHLALRITGSLTVTGVAGDGVAQTEQGGRLIDNVVVKADSFTIIDNISGRELDQITRRMIAQDLPETALTTANLQAAGAHPFEFNYWIPFARRYLATPFVGTALPPLNLRNGLTLEVEFNTVRGGAGTAGDDQGTGAFENGTGTDVYTFDVAPVVEVEAFTAAQGPSEGPIYLPRISSFDVENWTAANARLTARLRNGAPMDSVMLRTAEGALVNAENDLLNNVTLIGGNTRYIDDIPAGQLRADQLVQFPAAAVSTQEGYLWLTLADGGKLGNAFDPNAVGADPRFELNVATPSSSPGQARFTLMELISRPGVTRF